MPRLLPMRTLFPYTTLFRSNGPPYLSQTQIDLVRRWISAGAPQALAPPAQLKLMSSIPAAAESSPAGLDQLTVIFKDRKSTRLNSSHLVSSYAVFRSKKRRN